MNKSILSLVMSLMLTNCIVGQDKLIFTGFGQGFIGICDTSGNNYEEILSFSGGGSQGLKVDELNQKIYWSNSGNILSTEYNSQVVDTIYSSNNILPDIALDINGSKIFWSDIDEDKIFVSDLQGNNINEVYNEIALNVLSLSYNQDNNSLIFGRQNGIIGAISLSDNSIDTLTQIEHLPTELEIDTTEDKIYFINQYTLNEEISTIERCNYDGTEVETIIANLGNPFGLAISNTNIYWTDWDSDFVDIRSSNKQGGSITDLYESSNSNPYSLAIVSNLTVSTNEFITDINIEVFPNPTTNIIFFNTTVNFEMIKLVDFQGKVINEYSSNEGEISLNDVPSGIYTLCFMQKNRLIGTKKIVKK